MTSTRRRELDSWLDSWLEGQSERRLRRDESRDVALYRGNGHRYIHPQRDRRRFERTAGGRTSAADRAARDRGREL